ncbi:MAG: PAS domain S-box protein [Verrucomicrobiae bacterium]|nr:PAS domain S-box protein [Verrucomicrobiae bacterium]
MKKSDSLEVAIPGAGLSEALLRGTDDAVLGTDASGRVMFWNDGAVRLLGYEAEEILGRALAELIPESSRAREEAVWGRLKAGERVPHYETVRLGRDGREVEVSVTRSAIRDGAGGWAGVSEIARDVSEDRREQNRRIAEVEERLKVSFREIEDLKAALDEHAIVAITDARGRITYVNDKFCAISKYAREELLGQDHRLINSGHHPKEFIRDLWRTIGRGGVWHGELKNRARDGTHYWVDTTIVPFLDEAGRPRQYVAIRAEITERKLAEEALQRRTEELARSNHDLEQFAYVASHDLQEPLRAVAGCVQILQRKYGGQMGAGADELIGHVVDGAQRMRKLIDDLLEFSRVGTRGGKFQRITVGTALAEALRNLAVALEESGGRIVNDPLPEVEADPTQLTQLFQNLIGNAIKFRGPEAPRVQIGAERRGGWWEISVRDNGIGIEPQYFERLFRIFQRLHTRREYPGTGIGLAICRRIVERHGGRIWVESKPGEGTTFFFTLLGAS